MNRKELPGQRETNRILKQLAIEQGILEGKTLFNDKKLKIIGNPSPGAKVEIKWKGVYKDFVDYGYVFTLPTFDSEDIYMSGIIHIPRPCGYEKGEPEPEWHTLAYLTSLKDVKQVIIKEDDRKQIIIDGDFRRIVDGLSELKED